MNSSQKRKLEQVCWTLLSWRFDYDVQHLCNLLYFCNRDCLLRGEQMLFECDAYAVASGFSYEPDAMEIIKKIIFTRDFIEYWLRFGYYLMGYLDYFA